jgi:hypothetical protein
LDDEEQVDVRCRDPSSAQINHLWGEVELFDFSDLVEGPNKDHHFNKQQETEKPKAYLDADVKVLG